MKKIVVCVKQVNRELNPFDASALEYALRLPNAEVTILSMGRREVQNMLRELTRLGVAGAVLLSDQAFAGSDTLATAYILSLAVKKLNPDLIICGRQSIDGDTAQVGPCLSTLLGLPVITNVMDLHWDDSGVHCITRLGEESASLPALVTVERGVTLRFPRLRSKTGEVEIWSAAEIGADLSKCGLLGSPTRVLWTYESNVGRRKCTFISPNELPDVIEKALKSPRHIVPPTDSKVKLSEVWMVGSEPNSMAQAIAEKVRMIAPQNPEQIAALAIAEKPQVILWDNGPRGRKNAPQVAALLQTGLCADCTMLETDGEQLFMYRPAMSGSIMAKIVCHTRPQMATIRMSEQPSTQVIVSAGVGAVESLPALRTWADEQGYTVAASRAMVDKGCLPYECQIGQTGRTVSPAVYLACGISGALQHTTAIEQAGTIIAINRDKHARIFDYVDYGVVADCSDVFIK